MNNLNLLEKRQKSTKRITRSSKLFKTILHAIQEKKGENVVSLDLKKIHEAVTDFFIICEATNPVQLKSIADFVEEEVQKKCGEKPFKSTGHQGEQWILIDYINIVVHIMMSNSRKFYKLEEMWSDAEIKEHDINSGK
ncbi:MAG: ribosome silencing factor [Chitinophagaceae bacterium]|nr:ribosome silencing factor [Chitinophagaceae bacterium]